MPSGSKLFIQMYYGEVWNGAHAIISAKGQIVIPANLRKRYGLKEGTTILFHEDRGRLVLKPGNHAAIYALQESLCGCSPRKGFGRRKKSGAEARGQPVKEYVLDANPVLRYFAVSEGREPTRFVHSSNRQSVYRHAYRCL